MKKYFLIVLAVCITGLSFGQIKSSQKKGYEIDYMELSRKQKKIAWIMLGGGAVLATVPPILFVSTSELSDNNFVQKYIFTIGSITIGGLSMLGSIPVFISAAKNKGRALSGSTGFKMESAPAFVNGQLIQSTFPAISLKISL